MERVAVIMGKMHSGGKKNLVMEYYRNIDKTKIQFDFFCDTDSNAIPKDEITKLGGRVYQIAPYQNILKNMSQMKTICKKNNYKIMHAYNGTMNLFSMFVGWQCGIPIRISESISITCIDSDDFISPFFIDNLWTAIQESKCEIATSWFVDYYEGDDITESKKLDINDVQVLNKEEFYKKLLYQDGVEISAWGKLYKAELFKGVEYPTGKLYEDIPTTYLLVEKVTKIAVIPNIDYFYFQRKTSIAQANFSLQKMDAINHMNDFRNFITVNYPLLKKAAECRYFSVLCNILFQIQSPEFKQQQEELWNEIKKYRYSVLKNRYGRKKARVAALLSYGGYKFLYKIYVSTQKSVI